MRTNTFAPILTVAFLLIITNTFSQISHNDSIDYFDYVKINHSLLDITGKTMPAFVVKNDNGNKFTHDSLRSKVTFIDFWFEACLPCAVEFQFLEKFYNNNKSREGFQFISITYEADSVIDRLRKKYNLTYPIYRLSADSCRKIKFNLGYPTHLIINKGLTIVYAVSGGATEPEQADKEINYFIQSELNKQLLRNINQ